MYTGKYSAQFFGGTHLPSFALSASEIKTRLTFHFHTNVSGQIQN